jgi:YHS domain-containing protein
MNRTTILSAVAGACLFGFATAALAAGEFDDMCTMGLAMGKEVKTDCSINETLDGKKYCFGNEEAKTMFMKDPKANLEKAEAYMSKKKM